MLLTQQMAAKQIALHHSLVEDIQHLGKDTEGPKLPQDSILRQPQSVGLHDEINSIIAIAGLCSLFLARAIIQVYMAVNESNHWHKACPTPVR